MKTTRATGKAFCLVKVVELIKGDCHKFESRNSKKSVALVLVNSIRVFFNKSSSHDKFNRKNWQRYNVDTHVHRYSVEVKDGRLRGFACNAGVVLHCGPHPLYTGNFSCNNICTSPQGENVWILLPINCVYFSTCPPLENTTSIMITIRDNQLRPYILYILLNNFISMKFFRKHCTGIYSEMSLLDPKFPGL